MEDLMSARWTLNVPTASAETAPAIANSFKAQILGLNLLSEDSPTVMTEWEITSLHIPFAFALFTIAPPYEPPFEVSAEATLRIGGDVIAQPSIEPAHVVEKRPGVIGLTSSINEDLFNPLILPRGRSFTLDFALTATTSNSKQSILEIGLNQSYEGLASANPFLRKGPGQGILSYTVNKLSGHREL